MDIQQEICQGGRDFRSHNALCRILKFQLFVEHVIIVEFFKLNVQFVKF